MDSCINEEKRFFAFLQKQNCCLRCCFRFIGYRSLDCYQNPGTFAKNAGYIETEDAFSDDTTCTACLNILQNKILEQVIEKIQIEVKKQSYDCESFTCALTAPVCISFRERFLHVQYARQFHLPEDTYFKLKVKMQNVKDVWKWIMIQKIEHTIKKKVDLTTPSSLLIEIIFLYKNNDKECKILLDVCKSTNNTGNKRKRKCNDNRFSRKSIEALMAKITDEEFSRCIQAFPFHATDNVIVENIVCSHSSIFIGGRYNKLSRELSQTPWFINGEKKMETSVQDILCNPIAEVIKAQSIKFLSSGREDVDVRNLYSGRPFAIELINPRMTKITEILLSDLVAKINRSSQQVQITSKLKVLSRHDLKKLKEGENVKTKFYRAFCICRNVPEDGQRCTSLERLNNLKRVRIIQKTPIRVLHRRPLRPRERLIYEMRARWLTLEELNKLNIMNEDASIFFILDIKTQAGTYVKEFVHGDFGRTKPSLCDILNVEVDIVALDVTGINLDWP